MKKNVHMKTISSLLGGFLVFGVHPKKKEILAFLIKAKQEQRVVRLMYGETYDTFGMTIDSLKYYLFLSLLHRLLEKEGLIVESTVLIADRASILNPSVKEKEDLFNMAEKRMKVLKKIITLYDLPIRPMLMSLLFDNPKVQKTIDLVKDFSLTSSPTQQLFAKTVLQNKITQEKNVGFQYAVEAVAASLQFDIKIGPPREQFYDMASQIIGPAIKLGKVYGIYLRPTYPLGKNFSYFISNKEIEEFGITPYKAGSNKLQENRIILGLTSIEKVEELIDNSYIPGRFDLANPVFDLFATANLAFQMLEKDYRFRIFSSTLLQDKELLKIQTIKMVENYVFLPLQKGVFI